MRSHINKQRDNIFLKFLATYCARGESVPKFHYDYICERRNIKIKRINLTDPNERFNIRNPVVRRAEYYRAPYDILKACPDWWVNIGLETRLLMIKFTLRCHFFYIFVCFYRYGCNLRIAPEDLQVEIPPGLMEANETAFVGSGGKYWLALYYTQVIIGICYFHQNCQSTTTLYLFGFPAVHLCSLFPSSRRISLAV